MFRHLAYSHRHVARSMTVGRFVNIRSALPVTTQSFFSSMPGNMGNKLRTLDVKTAEEILKDLRDVDANSDGRLDSQELKQLLSKHNTVFTDQEVVEISELFYASKGGESVSFERFIQAIDRVSGKEENGQGEKAPWEEDRNPLGVDNSANEYIFVHRHHYEPEQLQITFHHQQPEGFRDRLALSAVKGVRFVFDSVTGWPKHVANDTTAPKAVLTPEMILQRAIFLETVAAVPGMVAAVVRHFRSLRNMSRDGGMLQMFLDEANNERMHLLSFVRMKDPTMLFKLAVIGGQVGFATVFALGYIISPQFCHRFVGYIEEEACDTYTKIIAAVESAADGTELAAWRSYRAPQIARSYWKLGEDGTVLDMIYAVRADEAEHRDVNHKCSTWEEGMPNPVHDSEEKLNAMLQKYVHELMKRAPERDALKN